MKESPACTPCVKWKFETAETWGLRFDAIDGMFQNFCHFSNFIQNFNTKILFVGGKLKPFKPIVTKSAVWEPVNGLV